MYIYYLPNSPSFQPSILCCYAQFTCASQPSFRAHAINTTALIYVFVIFNRFLNLFSPPIVLILFQHNISAPAQQKIRRRNSKLKDDNKCQSSSFCSLQNNQILKSVHPHPNFPTKKKTLKCQLNAITYNKKNVCVY